MSAERQSESLDKYLERPEHQEQLEAEAERGHERIKEDIERNIENKAERDSNSPEKEQAKHEALGEATSVEKPDEAIIENRAATIEHRRGKRSKKELDQSFESIMADTREQMSASSRAFSRVIHNRAVEAISETAGSTIARPNAILAGSVSAFAIVLGVYLVARYFGYPLSGSETLIAFTGGWLIGILFDFFRVMITGKK